QPSVNAFDDRLRNAQSKIAPLAARIRFTNHKHASFTLEKLTDFIRAQVPHFGDFRNGIMPLDVHRGLDLGWYGHCALVTPAGSRRSSNRLVGLRESCSKHSSCIQSPIELRLRKHRTPM